MIELGEVKFDIHFKFDDLSIDEYQHLMNLVSQNCKYLVKFTSHQGKHTAVGKCYSAEYLNLRQKGLKNLIKELKDVIINERGQGE